MRATRSRRARQGARRCGSFLTVPGRGSVAKVIVGGGAKDEYSRRLSRERSQSVALASVHLARAIQYDTLTECVRRARPSTVSTWLADLVAVVRAGASPTALATPETLLGERSRPVDRLDETAGLKHRRAKDAMLGAAVSDVADEDGIRIEGRESGRAGHVRRRWTVCAARDGVGWHDVWDGRETEQQREGIRCERLCPCHAERRGMSELTRSRGQTGPAQVRRSTGRRGRASGR